MPRKIEERDKSVRFISKLVQLTQDGEVEWKPVSPPTKSEAAYETNLEGQKLRIYKYEERIPNPDYVSYTSSKLTGLLFSSLPPPPETILRSGIVLEVVDAVGRPVYKFENRTGLSDLYESASYSAAKVDDLMNTILAKP